MGLLFFSIFSGGGVGGDTDCFGCSAICCCFGLIRIGSYSYTSLCTTVWKMSVIPVWFLAEHSTYLSIWLSATKALISSVSMHSASSSSASSLRSDFVPTKMMGSFLNDCQMSLFSMLACCFSSGSHFSVKFLKLVLSLTAKHSRKISVCGYDSGLSLSYSSWPAVSHRFNLNRFLFVGMVVVVLLLFGGSTDMVVV